MSTRTTSRRLAKLREPATVEADTLVAADAPARRSIPTLPIYAVADDALLARVGWTGDDRLIDQYQPRDLPMALYAQFVKGHGEQVTVGNPVVGQVQTFEQRGDEIRGRIVYFDTPEGRYAAQLAQTGGVNYISVDGAEVDAEQVEDDTRDQGFYWHVKSLTVAAATQCSTPASAGTAIGELYFPEGPEHAAATAAPAPEPAFQFMRRVELPDVLVAAGRDRAMDAFAFAEPDDPLRYVGDPIPGNIVGKDISVPFVESDGVTWHGYLAHWGTCHVGYSGECRTPPSGDDFAGFYRQVLTAAGGTEVPAGHITLGAGHAKLSAGAQVAAAHYDDTAARVAYSVFSNGKYGIWGRGVINPSATDDQIENFHRSRLSGDWRTIGGDLRLIAALVVNYPGFPIPDGPQVGVSADGTEGLIAAGDIPDEVDMLALVASAGDPETRDQFNAAADRMARSLQLPTVVERNRAEASKLAATVGTPKRRVTRGR